MKKMVVALMTWLVIMVGGNGTAEEYGQKAKGLDGLKVEAPASASYFSVEGFGKYVYGHGIVAHDKPVIQSEIGYDPDNGFGGSAFASLPASLQNIGENAGTEIDFNGWYRFWNVMKIGASYFIIYPDEGESFHKNDILQVNFEIAKEFIFGDATIIPGFRAEYNFPVNGDHDTTNTGLYVIPMIDVVYTLTDRWQAGLKTKFTIDMGGFDEDKALIIKLAPEITYRISDGISANAGIDIYSPVLKTEKDTRESQYVPHAGICYAF